MSESAIRFGVRTELGSRAGTWKLWTPGGDKRDVYLACRALKGELKASLHQSGRWHVAFSRKFYEGGFDSEAARPDSRFTDSWPRPSEIAPGITLAFRVVVPWFSATVPQPVAEPNVVWVPPAPHGHAIQFAVLITSPTVVVNGWPARRSMNSQLVGSFVLSTLETVWVVHTAMRFMVPPAKRGTIRFFKGMSAVHLKDPALRAIVFGEEPDGSRVMYDVPVAVTTLTSRGDS